MASFSYSTPHIWYQLPTVKVFKDMPPSEGIDLDTTPIKMFAAANEYESLQLVVTANGKRIDRLQISVSNLQGPGIIVSSCAEIFQVGYVYLETARSGFPTGWYPDPLIPFPESGIDISVGENQPLWIRWYVPPGTPPGSYQGNITLTANSYHRVIPIQFRVFAFELPVETHTRSAFGIWAPQILDHFNIQAGTYEAETILDKYYQFQLEHRFMPRALPIPLTDPRAAYYLNDPRLNSIGCPFYQDEIELRRIVDYLISGGWEDKAYFYVIDEPGPSQFPRVRETGSYLHRVAPEIPHLVTVGPREELAGYIDIWVPPYYTFQWRNNIALQRRVAGDGMWWYWCGSAAGYPTYNVDDYATSPRVLAWYRYRFSIEGELYWATTVYSRLEDGAYKKPIDVWENPQTGTGNGDGMLIYPGSKVGIQGPIGSIRTEMIREGMEDGEYFWLYEQARGKPLSIEERMGLTQEVCWDLNMGFERTGTRIYEVRTQIAERIEELSQPSWHVFETDHILYPIADAHIVENSSQNNYGNQAWFEIYGSQGYRREAFFKFKPGIIAATSSLTSATFSAVVYSGAGGSAPEIGLYICDFGWIEDEITWSGAPRNNLNERLVAKAKPNQSGRIYFQITDPEALQLINNEELTFLMRQLGTGNLTAWYTREHGWDARIPYLSLQGRFVKPPFEVQTGLTGIITNAYNQPLPGTKISNSSKWTTNGINGWYLLPLAPGIYDVNVEKSGYQNQQKTIEIMDGVLTQFDFKLLENDDDRTFNLSPNPFSLNLDEALLIDHKMEHPAIVKQIEIYNLNGALVTSFSPQTPNWSTWKGKDINGRDVSPGLYVWKVSYISVENSMKNFKSLLVIVP